MDYSKFLFSIFFGGMNEYYFGYLMNIYNKHMINTVLYLIK